MSVKAIIQEAINKSPLSLKETLEEELRNRIALALEGKMNDDDADEDEDEDDDDEDDDDEDDDDEDDDDEDDDDEDDDDEDDDKCESID